VVAHHTKQLAGRAGERKQAGHRHEGAEFPPIVAKRHIVVAEKSVGIRTEVKSVMNVRNQPVAPKFHEATTGRTRLS
jgi:hypothetical protein